MERFLLFVDGSVNPELKIGYGCYLLLPEELASQRIPSEIKERLKVKRFDSTSSSRLEIETLLWALKEAEKTVDKEKKILIYTDSQNITKLINRRERLEKENFQSGQKKTDIENANLYRIFYSFMDRLNIKVIKITGHSKLSDKNAIEKIFREVDRSARKALRKYIQDRQSG